jgi:acyl-CoA synthetase (AMP-forming)/AMP-acid ligase II
VQCKPGEPGLLVGVIKADDTTRRFEGYTDAAATKKKVLCDVLAKGDTWFNSGDLLRRDFWGWYYWCDRTGDTFRWKGENVATTEVEQVLTGCAQVADVAVYGVKVPNNDGRAGMAAVVLAPGASEEAALSSILREVPKNLPTYSRPLFLRVDKELSMTGTFKVRQN